MEKFLIGVMILGLCSWSTNIKAQISFDEECGTEYSRDPNFDPLEFEKWRTANNSKNGFAPIIIPIDFRIVRFSDGGGGLDITEVQGILDTLNKRYAGASISFEQCGEIGFVDEGLFYNFDRSLYADSLITYNKSNVLNVYFINKVLRSNDDQICGYASFPWTDDEYAVVQNNCALNGSTLAHELGHYLGLWHTHQVTDSQRETVNGSNCGIAGDELCDTPADPRLSGLVSSDCQYTGSATDPNGEQYQPDVTNIMSYSRKACRDFFSPQQIERIRFYLERDRSHLICNVSTSLSEFEKESLEVNVQPNPFESEFILSIRSAEYLKTSITIYSTTGRQVDQRQVQLSSGMNDILFDSNNYAKGIYFVQIASSTTQTTSKIVRL